MNSRTDVAVLPGVPATVPVEIQPAARAGGRFALLPVYTANGLTLSGLRLQTMIFAWMALGAAGQGWVGLVNGVPVFAACLFSVWGGLLADSPMAQRVLALVRLVLAGTAVAAAGLTAIGVVSPPLLLLLSMVFAAMTAVDTPIARSVLFDAAGDQPLLKVTSANSMVLNALNIAGPAAVGYLLGRFGGSAALILLGLAYAGAAALSLPRGSVVPMPALRRGLLVELTAGLAYLRSDRQLAWLVSLVLIVPLAGTFFAIVPLYARDVLEIGPAGYGLLMACYAVGNLAGSSYFAAGKKVRRKGRAIVVLGLAYGAAMAFFALSTSFVGCAAVAAIMGAIAMLWQNLLSSTIQLRTPDELRGRVLSVYTLGVQLLGLGWLLSAGMSLVIDARLGLMIAGLVAIALNVVAARRSNLLSLE